MTYRSTSLDNSRWLMELPAHGHRWPFALSAGGARFRLCSRRFLALISPPVAKPVWGLGGSSPPTSKNFMEIRERKEGEEEKKEIGEKRG